MQQDDQIKEEEMAGACRRRKSEGRLRHKTEDNIKIGVERKKIGVCELDSFCSGCGPMARFCKQ